MTAKGWEDYRVLATSDGEKLEKWNDVYLLRPDPQVIWHTDKKLSDFPKLNARYNRSSSGGGSWEILRPFKSEWIIRWKELKFIIKPMGFKHVGLFPEQSVNWEKCMAIINGKPLKVLNLFAYTGGATVACAKAGAYVTHVDAAKGMVERAKQNAALCELKSDSVRYIVDDCKKFVMREIKRGNRYDAIIMDPPSYGRGPGGELWKLEDNLFELVKLTKEVLVSDPEFYLINSYTTGLQPSVLDNILSLIMGEYGGTHEGYEVCLPTDEGIVLPCGCSGMWRRK